MARSNNNNTSINERIRHMRAHERRSPKAIARRLNIRYQRVRNVLTKANLWPYPQGHLDHEHAVADQELEQLHAHELQLPEVIDLRETEPDQAAMTELQEVLDYEPTEDELEAMIEEELANVA